MTVINRPNLELIEVQSSSGSENENTLRFERTISVSIETPYTQYLDSQQLGVLSQIFEDSFDFERFMHNFLQNFPSEEELLQNRMNRIDLSQTQQTPAQEQYIESLPIVNIQKPHCKVTESEGQVYLISKITFIFHLSRSNMIRPNERFE